MTGVEGDAAIIATPGLLIAGSPPLHRGSVGRQFD